MKALPAGNYCLLPVTGGVPDWPPLISGGPASTIDNVNCDGFRARTGWKIIQPDTTGNPAIDSVNYVWTTIDTMLTDCLAKGKKLGLSIAMGGNCPGWLWLVTPLIYRLTCDNGGLDTDGTQPLPWDTNYQARVQTFLTAFGLRYDGNPTLAYVVIEGFMQQSEMNFVFTPADDVAVNQIAAVPPGGYSGLAAYSDDNRIEQQIKCILTLGSAAVTFAPDNDPNTPQFDAAWDTGIRVKASGGVPGVLQNNTHFTVVDATHGTRDKTALQSGDFPITFIARYGRASIDAYKEGAEAIIDMIMVAFPTTSADLTYSRPFPTPPGVDAGRDIKAYGETTYPNHFGLMTASLVATCPPHNPPGQLTTNSKGFQAIYPSGNIAVYQGRVCPGGPWPPPAPQPLDDMLGNAYTQGAHFAEIYKSDMDAAINQPVLAARRLDLLSNAGIGGGGGGGLIGSYEKYATTPTGVDLYWTAYTPDLLPHPAVLAIHAGGYRAGVVVSEAVCVAIAARGFLVLSMEHRLAPPHLQMNSAQGHPFPGQDDMSDEGHFPEQTQDVARAIVTARDDARCNGKVMGIGGSAGGSHLLFLAATGLTDDDGLEHNGYASGVVGNTRLDRVVVLSPGVSNLADPNLLALDCTGSESTCPHDAVTNYCEIVDTWPLYGPADIEKLRIASPVAYFHSAMPPIYILLSTLDGQGIPTSVGLDLQGENGENGLKPKLQALGWTESAAAFPEEGKFKLTIVTVGEFAHAFAYFDHPGTNPPSVGPTLIIDWLLAEIGGGIGGGGTPPSPIQPLEVVFEEINFRDGVLYAIADLLGIDRDRGLSRARARRWISSIQEYLEYIWNLHDWPPLMLVEERAFRPIYNVTEQWNDGAEFYYLGVTPRYYRTLGEPPIGTLPDNVTYFESFALASGDYFIPKLQRCRRRLGAIDEVYPSDPRVANPTIPGPRPLLWQLTWRGLEVFRYGGNTVFIRYKVSPYLYTAESWSTSAVYPADKLTLLDADGEVYRAIVGSSAINPAGSDKWAKVPFPKFLASYVVYMVAADEAPDTPNAVKLTARAQSFLTRAEDELLEQGVRPMRYRLRGSPRLLTSYPSISSILPPVDAVNTISDRCVNEWGDLIPS